MDKDPDAAKLSKGRQIKIISTILPVFTHVFLLWLYASPIYRVTNQFKPNVSNPEELSVGPIKLMSRLSVFDEGEIYKNPDTRGTTPLRQLLSDDYWGKDISHFNSNKSWRPFSVLCVRGFKNLMGFDDDNEMHFFLEVLYNRYINVIIHTSLAELVSLIGVKLIFPPCNGNDIMERIVTRAIIKILFGLHPTHVECTANTANRPHLIGLFLSILVILIGCRSDGGMSLLTLLLVCFIWIIGLCSSETILFHAPAVCASSLSIILQRTPKKFKIDTYFLKWSIGKVGVMAVAIFGLSVFYIALRFFLGIDAINPGILTKYQHPFHTFSGLQRFVNYSYVTSIHIFKASWLDPIGEAHEYGFNSVPEIMFDSFDPRILFPLFAFGCFGIGAVYCFLKSSLTFSLFIAFLTWFATLFPITGAKHACLNCCSNYLLILFFSQHHH